MSTYTEAAFLLNGAVTREDFCHACDSDLLPGRMYATGAQCIGLSYVETWRARQHAPSEGIGCVTCGTMIVPPTCTPCGMREDECLCVEWSDNGCDEHPRPYSKMTGEPV